MQHLLLILGLWLCSLSASAAEASWITAADTAANRPNTWIAFRKDISLKAKPRHLRLKIACDSKYWLWINGELVVFEGQLKRGPARDATYYDTVDIAHALHKGQNQVAVLLWYFGKSGFSHFSSGKAGLYIDADDDRLDSHASWSSRRYTAYGTASGREPNFRLSEPNLLFDGRQELSGWQTSARPDTLGFASSQEIGQWNSLPWGRMVARPIPMFKDFGIKAAPYTLKHGAKRDTLVATLPGNIQFTPIIDLCDPTGGQLVDIRTNHTRMDYIWNLRAQYITRPGQQRYESLGWMNGEQLILYLPHGVTINSIGYRQTGYDCYEEGNFSCDDDFVNRFWRKAVNTLYVNMRDTYMDCPDRERAQWWGDVVILSSEAFYSLSTSSQLLTRKGILELAEWQRPDSVLFSPIPSIRTTELPTQNLASIGNYGFWNYYMNTGDTATLRMVYPAVRRYLGRWHLEPSGFTANYSKGVWAWADWGEHRDFRLISAAWHSIALDAASRMATLLGYNDDARSYQEQRQKIKRGFNRYWNGYCYRHPAFMGATDDRAQALAVLAGIADEDKYGAILRTLKSQMYASPYMERYVMEALFKMGYGEYAIERWRKRIAPMVDYAGSPTLTEFWDADGSQQPYGSKNHAWSGGALTVIAQRLMGVSPIGAGYSQFEVCPQYVALKQASLSFPTVRGTVKTAFSRDSTGLRMTVTVPKTSKAIVYIPSSDPGKITVDGKPLKAQQIEQAEAYVRRGKTAVWVGRGAHEFHVDP